jgi:hypothetical protein
MIIVAGAQTGVPSAAPSRAIAARKFAPEMLTLSFKDFMYSYFMSQLPSPFDLMSIF